MSRRRKIPFVQQLEATDCGAACLAMVLGHHGRATALAEMRDALAAGRAGTSAREIVEAGRRFGLRARGVKLEPADMGQLPTAAILHWGFDHFVVFERVTARGIAIVDPSSGPREVPAAEVGERFTGVALLFEPGEDFVPRARVPGSLRTYARRLAAHRGTIARAIGLSVLIQGLALALPAVLGLVVDRVVPRQDHDLLLLLVAGAAAVLVFHTLAQLLRGFLLSALRAALDAQLGLGFVDHLARLPFAYFMTRSSGDLLARFESNRTLRTALTAASLSTLLDGALVTVYLVLTLWASPLMGLVVILLGGLQIALFAGFRRPVRTLAAAELEAQARAQAQLVEFLAGIETLKASGAEGRAAERWSHAYVDEINVALRRARLGSTAGALSSALTLGAPLAILLAGAWQVLEGRITLGVMLTVNALAAGFLTPLSNLVATAFQLQEVRSHVERIDDVMSAAPEQDPAAPGTVPALSGAIELSEVSFRYGPREPWVVREVSLSVRPGQKVAIVGRSGAGKSTLARLLVGLYLPESGRIAFDGTDLRALDLRALRAQVGVVTQDAHVFGTTIRANIALGDPGAPLERIEAAARCAALHDEIERMPMRYDTVLTDGGASLSGGQRQRIALARALLREPAILLLDEATSDLDTLTESRVGENLARLSCTRIVIAHRLNTIVDADLVLALHGGAVVERGTHAELLEKDGYYARLVAAQIVP